jgi:hypothetical protein
MSIKVKAPSKFGEIADRGPTRGRSRRMGFNPEKIRLAP